MKRFLGIILLSILIFSVISATATTLKAQDEAQYKWVFMVYLDADNNLEGAGISDLNEMELAGSTNEVAIIVMIDRTPGYDTSNDDWTDTRIYLVKFDTDPTEINSELLVDLGEKNMGDPNTVIEFAQYVHENFPAEHYALVFWDHGNAWRRDSSGAVTKGVCWDDTNGSDYLTDQEILQALQAINDMGMHLDIVGFDVCLLGQAEIAYDIGLFGYADILVASQEYEPWDGWYYTPFLQNLTFNPDMSPEELASRIVDAFGQFYESIYPIDWATLAAINLSAYMNDVVPNINALGRILTFSVYYEPDTAKTIYNTWKATDRMGEGEFPDLYNFSENILAASGWSSDYDPRPIAQDLIYALENATINYWHSTGHPGAHGLSIYIPPSTDDYLKERYWYYQQTYMPQYTWWGLFLDYYFWRLEPPTEELKIIAATPAFVEKGSSDYAFIQILFGGTSIDPDVLSVTLLYPDGNSTTLTATKLSPGVYVIELPGIESYSTVLLKIDASYWFLDTSSSAAIKVSEIVEKIATLNDEVILSLATLHGILQNVEYEVGEIRGDTLTLLTQLGTISVKLSEIDAKIKSINGNIVTISTKVGDIKTSLDALSPVITKISDDVVQIQTSLGTITGYIESIDGDVATIKTDVGTIKANVDTLSLQVPGLVNTVSNISDTVENVNGLSGKSVTLLYVVIILLIIALILQVVYFFIKK